MSLLFAGNAHVTLRMRTAITINHATAINLDTGKVVLLTDKVAFVEV